MVSSRQRANLKTEEVGDARDVVRKHELPESHYSCLITAVPKVELPQKLSDLQRILERCRRKNTRSADQGVRTTETTKPGTHLSSAVTTHHWCNQTASE